MPTISVTMPVYNSEPYVAAAVQSILGQTFGDFEFLIIDDGSTDRSIDILRSFAEKDRRIRLVCHENRGISAARNEGLKMAVGEFLAVMDADDIALPQRLESQVEYLKCHPRCVAVSSRALFIDPDGDPITELFLMTEHEEIDGAHIRAPRSVLCHPSTTFRRQAVIDAGGYDDALPGASDYDLFLRLGERGRLYNMPRVLLMYRQHLQSFGNARHMKQIQGAELAWQHAISRRNLEIPDERATDLESPSATQLHQKWGWWALAGGNVSTARKYAWRALVRRPYSFESWRLSYCALRGY